ncbi:SRPBCC family protein [Leptospira idonii]|uniref:Activator of HSP90 ATPase n=1 Tax=Leptospira idonii TaxID=1193500 RepID=A0A4R9LU44_9LEPT|nr:SRPBCC family protein [Leptospira idonii]TGN17315.1 activator of HSP90 ATPase [Leptospira idonii]
MKQQIEISSLVSANVKKVWDYYTNPKHITSWNFADPSWHCPSATVNLTKGGVYNARMEAKDGSFGFDFEAIFDEVIENSSIAYTLGDQRKVLIKFLEKDQKTEVMIAFDPENENPVEMQKDGWQSILDNFKKYVESN